MPPQDEQPATPQQSEEVVLTLAWAQLEVRERHWDCFSVSMNLEPHNEPTHAEPRDTVVGKRGGA